MKILSSILNFSIMASNEEEDDDEDAEEDEGISLAASQSLDILALSLPPEKYISALLAQVGLPLRQPVPEYTVALSPSR